MNLHLASEVSVALSEAKKARRKLRADLNKVQRKRRELQRVRDKCKSLQAQIDEAQSALDNELRRL